MPTVNEIAAAGKVPVALPSPELIGAWSAISAHDDGRRRRRGAIHQTASGDATVACRSVDAIALHFASIQFSPTPTSTTSGGSSSNAPSISRLTSALASLDLVRGALEQQLVVDRQHQPRGEARPRAARRRRAPSRS